MTEERLEECPNCGEEPDIVLDSSSDISIAKVPDDIERTCSVFNYVWMNDHLYIHL